MASGRKLEIRECNFQLDVTEGIASVRFPCSFFFELKTANGKHHVASNHRVKANKGIIAFQETVVLNVLMVYDLKQEKYKKKEAVILVSLLSNSRPNDPKLVGRVTLDLSEVANQTYPKSLANHTLEYCSVKGQITFKIAMTSHKATAIEVAELDRSELIQGEIFASSNLKASKEEHQSQVLSTSSIRSHSRDTAKLGQSNLQERLARIKAQKMDLDKISKPSVRWKKEEEGSNGDSHPAQIVENGIKALSSDFSLPVLSKNCSDFDSMKNSQATMKQEISENVVKLSEMPVKEQIKIKTDKYIDHSDNYQSNQKGLSCRDVEQRKVEHENRQLQRQSISAIDDQEHKSLNSKLQQAYVRQAELSRTLKDKEEEIQLLKHSYKLREDELSKLTQRSELYEQSKNHFQQTAQQNQLIKREMAELQATLSTLQIEHQQVLDLSAAKDQRIAQLLTQLQQAKILPHSQTRQNEMQQLKHQVQTQQKKHHNTQIELEEIREWFSQLQEKYQNLEKQSINLTQQRDNLRFQLQVFQNNQPRPIETQKKNIQDQQITDLKNILQEKEKQVMMLMQELTHLSDELAHKEKDKEQIQKQLDIIKKELELNQIIEKEMREKIEQLSHDCEEKELKLLEKGEDLQQEKQNTRRVQQTLRQKDEQGNALMREAGSVAEDSKRRLEDLVIRMRQKEQGIAKLQRENERYKQQQRQYQFQISKYKQKIKASQQQRLEYIQKQTSIENDLKQLTRKLQRQQDLKNLEISRYKLTLDQESTKRRELERQISQLELSIKDQNSKLVSELESKIALHLDKEEALRDSLNIVENEVNRIGDLLQEKEEREEHYNQIIVGLNQKQEVLIINISNYQNQLNFMRQRCEALEGEVELLNAYAPQGQDQNEMMEINKKITEQNKGLLSQIEEKNRLIEQLEKGLGENRINASQQELSNSRFLKEKSQLQQRLAYLTEENQKLYKEFDRVNLKYEEELEAMERINGDRITELVREIEQLSINLYDKDIKVREARQKYQNIENALINRQAEKDRYLDQIKELIEEKESLKTKLVVLNEQYESIYSQLGEKEYQLYEATGKLKDLQEKIVGEKAKEAAKPNKDQIEAETNSKIEHYLSEIQQLKLKVQQRDEQTQALRNNLQQIKLEAQKQISKLQSIKSQIQNDYQARLDNLNVSVQQLEALCFKKDQESQEMLAKVDTLQNKNNQLLAKTEELQQQISFLQKQRSTLKDEIEYLSSKEIGRTTPIHQFQQSPLSSVCKIQRIDLNYTVEEITNIIARRKDQEEIQGVLRLVIENNARYEDDTERWSRQRGAIQQKAKMASRQIQKMKSQIMKTPNRSIGQKSQMTGLLRPVQKVIGQLINMSENLLEWQLQHQGQQERQKENV